MSTFVVLIVFALVFAGFVWWITRTKDEPDELPTEKPHAKAGTVHTLGDTYKDPLSKETK